MSVNRHITQEINTDRLLQYTFHLSISQLAAMCTTCFFHCKIRQNQVKRHSLMDVPIATYTFIDIRSTWGRWHIFTDSTKSLYDDSFVNQYLHITVYGHIRYIQAFTQL